MEFLTRRGFAGASMATLASIGVPRSVFAAPCAAAGMPALVPNRLSVNCASRDNFRMFRQYSGYVGLAGVVSMIDAPGPGASYRAGTLYLYPWLKPKGLALRGSPLRAASPAGGATVKPIPGSFLPQDEFLCRFVLKAPWRSFIGFMVDVPLVAVGAPSTWYTLVPKLADGQPVGVDWTSSNLNASWFAGGNIIPDQDTCNGSAWRALIVEALNLVASGGC